MKLQLMFFYVQTVDVFAIVALSGIVSKLLTTGTVLVATSNKAPENLNQVVSHPACSHGTVIFYLYNISRHL